MRKLWHNRIFNHLNEWQRTKKIAGAVNVPTRTTKMHLEDLMITGALNRDVEDEGETAAYVWQLSSTMWEFISNGEIFPAEGTLA